MSLTTAQKIRRAKARYARKVEKSHALTPELQALERLAKTVKVAPPEKGKDKFIPRFGGFKLTRENIMSQGTYIRVCGMRTRSLDELAWKF